MKKWLFLCLIIFGCSERIIHFTNPNAIFSDYSSFAIANNKSNIYSIKHVNNKTHERIDTYVHREMINRNYKTDVKSPDLIARYDLISTQKSRNLNNQPLYTPVPSSRSTVYEEYSLLVELIDRKKSRTVWQASIDLDKFKPEKNNDALISKALQDLFTTYLYKADESKTQTEQIESKER